MIPEIAPVLMYPMEPTYLPPSIFQQYRPLILGGVAVAGIAGLVGLYFWLR
jgi:hypothetical protein